MKKTNILLPLLLLIATFFTTANAQEQGSNEENGIMFSVRVRNSSHLSKDNVKLLLSKVERALARCQATAAASDEGPFFVEADLVDVSSNTSDGLVRTVTSVKGELTLLATNSFNGATYYSATIPLSAAGVKSTEQMEQALVSSIKVNDAAFVRFVRQARKAINDYFTNHCDELIAQANAYITAGAKGSALRLCLAVPPSAPCFHMAVEMIDNLKTPEPEPEPEPEPAPVEEPQPAPAPEPEPAPAPQPAPAPVETPAPAPAPVQAPQPQIFVSDPNWKVDFINAEYLPAHRCVQLTFKITNLTGANTYEYYTRLMQVIDANGGMLGDFDTKPKSYIAYPSQTPMRVEFQMKNLPSNPGNLSFVKFNIGGDIRVELRNVVIK